MIVWSAVIFGTAAVLMTIPMELQINAERSNGTTISFSLGGIRIYSKMLRRDRSSIAPRSDQENRRRFPAKKMLSIVLRLRPLLAPTLGKEGQQWLRRSLRSVDASVEGAVLEIGFSDPADTGCLYGAWNSVALSGVGAVEVRPDFSGRHFAASGFVRLRSNLFRLLSPSIRFLFEPRVLKAVWRTFRDAPNNEVQAA